MTLLWIFFPLYKRFFGLRVSPETELKGLDIPEMGGLGYHPDSESGTPEEIPAAAVVTGGDVGDDELRVRACGPRGNSHGVMRFSITEKACTTRTS